MRLLIVEDDDDIAVVIEQTLRADGHDVDRASNGVDGLWMAKEGSYGAVVLDVLMPGKNGYVVCRELREAGSDVPVLMLTAKAGEYDETDGLDSGADDYLRKPFSPNVLQARVRALLRRGGSQSATGELVRGGVRLVPSTRECSLDGEPIELTGRQADVLEALLRAGSTPISRLDLVTEVWGLDFDGDPNIADVYLRYLRNKLGRDTIENVRGLGYRVRA